MIVQIHGTSGAGKSTLARLLMDYTRGRGGAVAHVCDERVPGCIKPILGYSLRLPRRKPVYLVGKYESPCGGCDQVGSSVEVLRRVRVWAKHGSVLLEGLLLSGGQGSLGRALKRYGSGFACAFLDTPLALCIKRVNKRRQARAQKRGRTAPPLNPKNTTSKWHACQRYQEKARALGYRVVVLDHRDPLPALLKLLGLPS